MDNMLPTRLGKRQLVERKLVERQLVAVNWSLRQLVTTTISRTQIGRKFIINEKKIIIVSFVN